MRKNCSSDQENLLKLEAEGQEFAKILRPLEQVIQTVKGQNTFWLLYQLEFKLEKNIEIWKHVGEVRE